MNKKNILFLILIVCFSCFLGGCGKKQNKTKPPMPSVTIGTISEMDVPVYVNAIGQAIAPVTVNIRPQIRGKLIKAYVKQGAIVEEGDVLYEIDPRPYEAILEEAVAQLAHDEALLKYAEQAVARNKRVVEEDFISKINFEQYLSNEAAARAQVEFDKASITAAAINVEFSKVTAPVAGKISYFNVDVGNVLVADDPTQITVIRPFSPIDIIFSLPQQQFESIRKEQGDEGEWKFVANLPDNPEMAFDGKTYFIDNQINQNTGTILLKGTLPNEERALWPGEFIRIKVLHKMVPNALTVVPSAVLIGKDGPYIYTVDSEGKAIVQNVEVITRTEQYIAIQSPNIKAGDAVIVDGQINVAPGLTVSDASVKKE